MSHKKVVIVLLIMFCASHYVYSREIEVGVNRRINTIQKAVEKASRGDTITIDAGRYTANIELDKVLHFRSASGEPDVIWEGVKDAREAGALEISKAVKGTFKISNIQFTGFTGWIVSSPKPLPKSKINFKFENCTFENSYGLLYQLDKIIMKNCKISNLNSGVIRCKKVELVNTPVSGTDIVIESCVSLVIFRSPIDSCGDVIRDVEEVSIRDLIISNTKNTVFSKVKNLVVKDVSIENGGTVAKEFSGKFINVKITNFTHAFVSNNADLTLVNSTLSNIKNTAIDGNGHKITLSRVEVSFCPSAVSDATQIIADDLKLKGCKIGISNAGTVQIEDSFITKTQDVVFKSIQNLTVEDTEIIDGGTVADDFSGTFEDVVIENFNRCFVSNKGDLRLTDVKIVKINNAGIDANGHNLILSNVSIASCPTAIINSPHIVANKLTVVGCGTGGIATGQKNQPVK